MNPLGQIEQTAISPTPLSLGLGSGVETAIHCGAMTPRAFAGVEPELNALLHGCGVSDLGWRGKILVTGEDRLRWLNGMVSNAVQGLPEGQGNYSFLLSVQGRIQGDCYVYRRAQDLLLDTSLDQIPLLMQHLDHYIIMDDVELKNVSAAWTGLALAGPRSRDVLAALGCDPQGTANRTLQSVSLGETACTLVVAGEARYELWFAPEDVLAVWETLLAASATPCGLEATEALRVLDGVPLYGVDLNDRDLPQETAQTRALNFSKGCYLGQEIVERIRSRGKVNRTFRQFSLQGTTPASLPLDLLSEGQAVGRITSVASLASAGIVQPVALGIVRLEVLERNQPITYEGGTATVFSAPATQP
jgi:folate-binding protein YgfZ